MLQLLITASILESSSFGVMNFGSNVQNLHQDVSSYGSYSSFGNDGEFHLDLDQEFKGNNIQHAVSVPISEHVEITKPVAVPVVKNIGKTLQTVTMK